MATIIIREDDQGLSGCLPLLAMLLVGSFYLFQALPDAPPRDATTTTPDAKVYRVTLCQLTANPESFNHKRVILQAILSNPRSGQVGLLDPDGAGCYVIGLTEQEGLHSGILIMLIGTFELAASGARRRPYLHDLQFMETDDNSFGLPEPSR